MMNINSEISDFSKSAWVKISHLSNETMKQIKRIDPKHPAVLTIFTCSLLALHALTSTVNAKAFTVGCGIAGAIIYALNAFDLAYHLNDKVLVSTFLIASAHFLTRRPGVVKEMGAGIFMTATVATASFILATEESKTT